MRGTQPFRPTFKYPFETPVGRESETITTDGDRKDFSEFTESAKAPIDAEVDPGWRALCDAY